MDVIYIRGIRCTEKLNVFKFHLPDKKFYNTYQYAPLRFVFHVKRQDLRRKYLLVLGGHAIDLSDHESYASTVQYMSIRFLLTIAEKNQLKVMSGDVGNTFPNAYTKEKIYSRAGIEFGEGHGCIIQIVKAIY